MSRNILFLFSIVILTSFVNCKHPLYVGALLELSNNWYAGFANFFVTIWEYAFEEIENRTDILADYSLQLVMKDTQAESGMAARRMFELMTGDHPVVCVLGPSLSHEMTVVGQVTPYYHVMQISYVSSTSSTVDRDNFPTLFRVNHIRDNLNPLRIKIMRYFDWTRVGTIFLQNDMDGPDMVLFHDILSQHNMTLVTSAAIPDDDTAEVSYVMARLKMPVTVLKRKHTLVGKSAGMDLLKKFKEFVLPRGDFSYDRMASTKKTEDLSLSELKQAFATLTAESADDLLGLLDQQVNEAALRRLLHVTIIMCNEKGQPDGQDLQPKETEVQQTASEDDDNLLEPAEKKKETVSAYRRSLAVK